MPLTWHNVEESIQKALAKKIAAQPTLPTLTTSLVALLQDPRTEPKEIAKIASTDPAVATEILRAVNSAYFALREPCNDLDRAILLLGYNWVKFLVVRLGMHHTNKSDPEYTARLSALWHHSFMTSECVAIILRFYTKIRVAEASTAALLHDLGRLIKMDFEGKDGALDPQLIFNAAGIPTEERVFVEEELFGINHCVVGSMMADHLNLPPLVKTVQAYHHHSLNGIWNLPQEQHVIQIIAAVKLADIVTHAFRQQLNPQLQIVSTISKGDPDLTDFRLFFPNLPSFPVLMGELNIHLRQSLEFLETFIPQSPPTTMPGFPDNTTEDHSPETQSRSVLTPPEAGYHGVGEIYYNAQYRPGHPIGWACIEEGEPGQWRAFGKTLAVPDEKVLHEHPPLFHERPDRKPSPLSAASPSEPTAEKILPEEPSAVTPLVDGLITRKQQPPSGGSPVPSSSGSSPPIPPDPIRTLFNQYIAAKTGQGEDVSQISFKRFSQTIEKARQVHRQALTFQIAVRNGKVTLVARKKGNPSATRTQ